MICGQYHCRQIIICQNVLQNLQCIRKMANVLEEKLREASCIGDLEAVEILVFRNVNVNSQNPVNGW